MVYTGVSGVSTGVSGLQRPESLNTGVSGLSGVSALGAEVLPTPESLDWRDRSLRTGGTGVSSLEPRADRGDFEIDHKSSKNDVGKLLRS